MDGGEERAVQQSSMQVWDPVTNEVQPAAFKSVQACLLADDIGRITRRMMHLQEGREQLKRTAAGLGKGLTDLAAHITRNTLAKELNKTLPAAKPAEIFPDVPEFDKEALNKKYINMVTTLESMAKEVTLHRELQEKVRGDMDETRRKLDEVEVPVRKLMPAHEVREQQLAEEYEFTHRAFPTLREKVDYFLDHPTVHPLVIKDAALLNDIVDLQKKRYSVPEGKGTATQASSNRGPVDGRRLSGMDRLMEQYSAYLDHRERYKGRMFVYNVATQEQKASVAESWPVEPQQPSYPTWWNGSKGKVTRVSVASTQGGTSS